MTAAASTASQDNSRAEALGSRPIGKLLVQYSVPAIIASVAVSAYNIVDSIFIGRAVGPMALTALAINLPLMNLLIAFCMWVAVGGATVSSIFLGQKNKAKATDTVNNVMLTCLIHAVVFGGVGLWWLDDILRLFGATDATLGYAAQFMKIYLYATPISYVFIGLNNLMRATGYPRKAMVSALLSVAVNVGMCPVFIIWLGWGMRGAALATVCGQAAAFIWVLAHFLDRRSLVHLDWKNAWWNAGVLRRIYSIGLSPFCMNVMACIVVVFLNHALLDVGGAQGNLDVGAFGILNRVTMVFVMVVFGVTQGMQPILGYNYGAGRHERVRRCLFQGIWWGVAITGVGWVLTLGFPDMLSGMFTTDRQLIDISRHGFRTYFIFYPVVGAQIVIGNFFQSIGHWVVSLVLSLTRQLIFLLPLLFILPRIWGVTGVWASMCGSDMAAFLAGVGALWWFFGQQNHGRARGVDSKTGKTPQ